MEFLSHVAIVAGILLFVYSLIKRQTYKIPPTKLKGNNILSNENPVEKTSSEKRNMRAHSESKLDHYGRYVAIKSKNTPHGKPVGLAAEEAFFLMRNSENPHIAVDDEGNIHYC